jgi:hypothetical protein
MGDESTGSASTPSHRAARHASWFEAYREQSQQLDSEEPLYPYLAERSFHLARRRTGAAGRRPTDVCNPLIRFSKSQKNAHPRFVVHGLSRRSGSFATVRCLSLCRCRSGHVCVRPVCCSRPAVFPPRFLRSGSFSAVTSTSKLVLIASFALDALAPRVPHHCVRRVTRARVGARGYPWFLWLPAVHAEACCAASRSCLPGLRVSRASFRVEQNRPLQRVRMLVTPAVHPEGLGRSVAGSRRCRCRVWRLGLLTLRTTGVDLGAASLVARACGVGVVRMGQSA